MSRTRAGTRRGEQRRPGRSCGVRLCVSAGRVCEERRRAPPVREEQASPSAASRLLLGPNPAPNMSLLAPEVEAASFLPSEAAPCCSAPSNSMAKLPSRPSRSLQRQEARGEGQATSSPPMVRMEAAPQKGFVSTS